MENTKSRLVKIENHPRLNKGASESWAALSITNLESEPIRCECAVQKIHRTGYYEEQLTHELVAYTPLLAWAGGGGSMKSLEPGLPAILNVVTPTSEGLKFQTDYGQWGTHLKPGIYKLELCLRGTLGGEPFQDILIDDYNFEFCIAFEPEPDTFIKDLMALDPEHPDAEFFGDVISAPFGSANSGNYACVRLM